MAFSKDIIDSICSYMNDDPTGFNRTIVNGHVENKNIDKAELISFDEKGVDFKTYSTTGTKDVNIPWERNISERFEVREQLFALFNKAMDKELEGQ